jgi:hypothetical protein
MVFPGVMRACIERHERVYQAIVEGDSQTAEVVTKQFLERVNNLIEDLLGGGSLIADMTRDSEFAARTGVENASPA